MPLFVKKIKKKVPGAAAVRAAVVAAVAGPIVLAGAQAADAGWTLQNPVVPPGATGSAFASVSCASTTMCMAVGTSFDHSTASSLAELWNGTNWTIEPTPASLKDPQLESVSCVSVTDCTAVGTYFLTYGDVTLAEHWDGTGWTVQATPNPPHNPTNGQSLIGVSCPSANRCMAMGSGFAERWNGTKWKLLPIPAGADLRWVSCRSGRSCLAVGWTYQSPNEMPEAATWNGTSWTAEPGVLPSGSNDALFQAVSCGSATSCMATGTYGNNGNANQAMSQVWNGTSWALRSTAPLGTVKESGLDGVDCVRPASCTAVGGTWRQRYFKTLSEHWTGLRWTVQASARPAGSTNSSLTSVSCPIEKFCVAVGDYVTRTNRHGIVLAEQVSQS